MKPIVVSQTGVGSTVWIPMDYHRNPFNVGFGVVVTGTVTYSVEHTFFPDILTNAVVPAADVFPHDSIVGQTTSQDQNYAFPVSAIRVTVTAGTGSVNMTLIQAGIRTG